MPAFSPYLERLRQIAPLVRLRSRKPFDEFDARLVLPGSRYTWGVEIKNRLTIDGAQDVVTRLALSKRRRAQRLLLCIPFAGDEIDSLLAERDVDYVDLAGNVRIIAGPVYVHLTGRRPPARVSTSKGIRAAGFQVLLVLLIEPELAHATARALARAAGVSKSAAAETVDRLRDEGWLAGLGRSRKLLRPKDLVTRWVEGWATIVRPRLLVGKYAVGPPDPETLESRIVAALGARDDWAFGGSAAAARLGGSFRGRETVLHVARPLAELRDLPRMLGAVPSAQGALTLFHAPAAFALRGPEPRAAHPMLVYAELLAQRDERAREAATDLRERFLS